MRLVRRVDRVVGSNKLPKVPLVPPGGTFRLSVSGFAGHLEAVLIAPLLPTYARADLAFERGEGAWLFTAAGERYLDFTSGVAVNALGHAHPYLVKALTEQAQKLWHVSNLYRIPEAERIADRLCTASFADMVFFGNSGAEAMELAIKMARKFQSASGKPERFRIITYEGAFHGRTLATLAAGGQKKYLDGFGPVVEGFDQMPFADLEATKRAIGPETAAILIEPIMGEGGVRVVPPEFLRALRKLCDQHGLLLVFDEVQSGMGRSGELFAYQRAGVTPDIMALAKGLTELHGGRILASSEGAGKGSEFTVELPLEREAAVRETRIRSAPAAAKSYKIIVIEDCIDAAESMGMLLHLMGHDVEKAYDGPVGIELAKRFQPDVVICDIGLPGPMDGYAVAQILRLIGAPGDCGFLDEVAPAPKRGKSQGRQ